MKTNLKLVFSQVPWGKLGVLFAVLRADCVKSFQWLSRLKILPKTQNMLYSAGSSELCQNAKKMWNNRNNITCCGRHITVAAATYVVQTGLKSCHTLNMSFLMRIYIPKVSVGTDIYIWVKQFSLGFFPVQTVNRKIVLYDIFAENKKPIFNFCFGAT